MIIAAHKIAGLSNVLPPESMVLSEMTNQGMVNTVYLYSAMNVDINDQFHPLRRRGKVQKHSGVYHSGFATPDFMLAGKGTGIVAISAAGVETQVVSVGFSSLRPIEYILINNIVYLSDGVSTGIVELAGLKFRSWGLAVPPAPLVIPVIASQGLSAVSPVASSDSETPSNLTAIMPIAPDGNAPDGFSSEPSGGGYTPDSYTATGRRGYRMCICTYVRSDGQESGASEPTSLMVPETASAITITTNMSQDPDCAFVNFYVSAPDGEQTYLYGQIPNTPSTLIATFNADMVTPLPTFFALRMDKLEPPPAGNHIEYFNTKIYVAKSNYIIATVGSSYELSWLVDYIFSPSGSITMLKAVDNGLWVATESEIWFFSGDNTPFTAVKKADYGVVNRSAAKRFGLLTGDTPSTYIIAMTLKGFIRLGNDGVITPMTEKTYRPETPLASAACITDDRGFLRYMAAYSDIGAGAAEGIYN